MHRGLVAVTLVGLVALAGVAVGAAGAVVGAAVADSTGAAAGLQEDVDPDDVLLAIAVGPDGEADWTIEYRTRLETDEDEQAFAELQEDVENNSTAYEQRFHDRMNATADSAAETTGREMTVTDMRVSAEKRELPREYGVVTYRFRWTGFAAVDGDRATVGDAIDGLFLDEDTTLRVAWTADHVLLDATPDPDETREGAVVWNGPTSFGSGEPRIDLGPPGAASPDDPGPSVADSPMAFATLLVLLVVGTAALAFVYYRRREHRTVADDLGSSDGDPDGGAGAAGVVGATGSSGVTAATDEEIDPELLSNEEQVLRLVERNGGRMKQRAVAEELGWTDAKTSQVTKGLREDGDLEGFRLGRENVLALPDERGGGDGPVDDRGDTDVEADDGEADSR